MATDFRPTINIAYADANPTGLPVATGVPFPQGMLRPDTPLAAEAPSGELRPAAGRPLAWWPDGSVRWSLVQFGARETGDHVVRLDAQAPAAGVTLTRDGDRWIIASDRVRVAVCETGPGVLGELVCDGRAYLARPEDLCFRVDDASTQYEERRSVRVIEESSLRVRLRVEGAHFRASGARHLSYRLDIDLWAGWPTVRLDYQFFNLEPGADSREVGRIALDTAWQLGTRTTRHFLQQNYGLFYISRHVFNPDPVSLLADLSCQSAHVEDPAMLLDDIDYPFYLNAPLVNTHDWLGVGDTEYAVYVKMTDMAQTRPNRVCSEANRLSAEFWPAVAGPLDLPQGRSKRQTVLLAFVRQEAPEKTTEKLSGAPHQAPKGVAAMLDALNYEDRACVAPAWFAHCREFDQHAVLPIGQHIRIEGNLAGLMQLNMPYTKFDVGDTPSGYNRSYAVSDDRLVRPLPGAPDIPRLWPNAVPTQTYLDCHEPVWTNNEYDAIHAFANEIMRTGRHGLIATLRAAARHNIEVDFLHYSDHRWLHRASPAHSARHTTTGAYPSHFWTEGLLEYYCLTGDIDALEVAEALGDKIIENLEDPDIRPVLWGFTREVGWSILSLTCLFDITRAARFKPLLDEMVDYLLAVDRQGYTGAVNLSGGNDRQSLNRQIVGNFFGYQSMVDAVDKYATTTGRPDVIAWLTQLCYDLADASLQASREGHLPDTRFGLLLAVGYERTNDERFLAQIGVLLDQMYWNAQGLQSNGASHAVGSGYRGVTRMLGHAWRHGLLDAYEFPNVKKLRG